MGGAATAGGGGMESAGAPGMGGMENAGESGMGGTEAGATACNDAADCAWGEINREILEMADCPCLLGCPYLPMNVETLERRLAQYTDLCDPSVNGAGNPCPIDDCVQPPELECLAGECTAP